MGPQSFPCVNNRPAINMTLEKSWGTVLQIFLVDISCRFSLILFIARYRSALVHCLAKENVKFRVFQGSYPKFDFLQCFVTLPSPVRLYCHSKLKIHAVSLMIVLLLCVTESLCRDRWRSIRACFGRHLRNKNINRKPYYLAEYLDFLRPFTSAAKYGQCYCCLLYTSRCV